MKLLLTGQLPFILLLATILALPISLGLLRLYRRAVVRSMRATAGAGSIAGGAPEPSPSPEGRAGPRPAAAAVEALLRGGPWRAATVYGIASCAYAANGTPHAIVRLPDRRLRELPLLLSALAKAAHA
jgi:hypothetical protein